jgi:hypothetical protein
MNQDQILGAVRSILAVVGGWAVGHGYVSGDQLTLISGAVAAIVPLVWSFLAHSKNAQVATVQAMDDMQVATSSQAVKDAVPGVTMAKPGAPTVVVPAPSAPLKA